MGRTASAPSDATIGGYPAKRIELTVPADLDTSTCTDGNLRYWPGAGPEGAGPDMTSGLCCNPAGNVDDVYAVDIAGRRTVVVARSYPGTSVKDKAELQSVVDSIQIEPLPPLPSASASASPGPVVSQSPAASPSLQAVRISVAGTEVKGPPLQLKAALPADWTPGDWGADIGTSQPPAGLAFIVSLIDDTFKDPCSHVERSPKVGPTVADAATALGEIPDLTATQPVQTTIAGYAATSVELTVPASLSCAPDQFYLWQDSPGGDWWVQGLNERIQVWILEVGGQRVAITTHSYSGTSAAAKAELQKILDSIVFDGGS